MTDQNSNPNSGIEVPGESGGSAANPAEQRARELGWRPKEEWSGPETDWIDAQEFVRRQPLFDRIDDLKNQLWHMKKDMAAFAEHHRKVAEVEFKRAMETLQAQRREAAKEGDIEAVTEISDQIAELKEQKANTPPPAQPQIPAEFVQWNQQNPWYNSDQELTTAADAYAVGLRAREKDITLGELLKKVTDRMAKIYPEKFGGRRPTTSAVEDGGNTSRPKSGGKLTKADLNEIELATMKRFVQRGALTEAQYLSELEKTRGNK